MLLVMGFKGLGPLLSSSSDFFPAAGALPFY
jgi:hypothetical protein